MTGKEQSGGELVEVFFHFLVGFKVTNQIFTADELREAMGKCVESDGFWQVLRRFEEEKSEANLIRAFSTVVSIVGREPTEGDLADFRLLLDKFRPHLDG